MSAFDLHYTTARFDPPRFALPDYDAWRTLSRPAYDAAHEAVIEAVERGCDRLLPLDCSRASQYPVSTYLGECSKACQELLFKACHEAEAPCHPSQIAEQNARVAVLLRKFVEAVATEYADDNQGAWE